SRTPLRRCPNDAALPAQMSSGLVRPAPLPRSRPWRGRSEAGRGSHDGPLRRARLGSVRRDRPERPRRPSHRSHSDPGRLMHGRFLMLLDRTGLGLDPAESRLLRGSAAKAGLTVRCSTPALLLACSSELDCILLDDGAGALLGRGFERGTNRKVDANALQPLADRQPSAWTERFWGAWLAIVKPAGAVGYAVREPSGLFPAYYAAGEASLFVASDATLLREVRAIGGAIAWPRLASGLVHPDLRVSETALSGCNELIPGCALRLPGLGQELAWSPADHASGPTEVRSLKWSADVLRETLQACVAAWSRGSRRLLLELSGGLDSSIVAACLAPAGADVVP